MPLSRNLNTYGDVKQILDEAVKQDGLRLHLKSNGQAVHWRLRAYQFRKLYQTRMADLRGHEMPTDYDSMVLTLDGPAVVINFRVATGTLTTLDGKPVELSQELAPATEMPHEELTDEEAALVEALKNKGDK